MTFPQPDPTSDQPHSQEQPPNQQGQPYPQGQPPYQQGQPYSQGQPGTPGQPYPQDQPYPGGPAYPQGQPYQPGTPGYPAQPGYPPPGYPGQPPYGYPYPMYNPSAQTNTMAILSLIFAFVFAPLGAVFGHIARKQIRERGEGGAGLATAGLIIGYVLTVVYVLYCAGVIVFVVANSNH